jgi:hypothetical protein
VNDLIKDLGEQLVQKELELKNYFASVDHAKDTIEKLKKDHPHIELEVQQSRY